MKTIYQTKLVLNTVSKKFCIVLLHVQSNFGTQNTDILNTIDILK